MTSGGEAAVALQQERRSWPSCWRSCPTRSGGCGRTSPGSSEIEFVVQAASAAPGTSNPRSAATPAARARRRLEARVGKLRGGESCDPANSRHSDGTTGLGIEIRGVFVLAGEGKMEPWYEGPPEDSAGDRLGVGCHCLRRRASPRRRAGRGGADHNRERRGEGNAGRRRGRGRRAVRVPRLRRAHGARPGGGPRPGYRQRAGVQAPRRRCGRRHDHPGARSGDYDLACRSWTRARGSRRRPRHLPLAGHVVLRQGRRRSLDPRSRRTCAGARSRSCAGRRRPPPPPPGARAAGRRGSRP